MNVPIVGSDVEGIVETIGKDGDKGRIWKDKMGQQGFNEILTTITSKQDMVQRAKKYVEEKISNRIIINDIV